MFISLLLLFFLSCSNQKSHHLALTTVENAPTQIQRPYVLLISLDGYRHDYVKLYRPPFLSQFAAQGLSAESLISSFPSKTFPNHYTIVTGLYPDHHGIVANEFWDPDLQRTYRLGDSQSVTDGRFYKGVPLWNLAVKQGMVSATYFWPGSEADINHTRPSIFETYNHGKPHAQRTQKIIEWLSKHEKERPHFLTLYFHDIDSAAHKFGPESEETKDAVLKVDATLEKLVLDIHSLPFPVNIVIVSDHGMTATPNSKYILLDKNMNSTEINLLEHFKVVGKGPIVHFHYQSQPETREEMITLLLAAINKEKNSPYQAYLRRDVPAEHHFNQNKRNGDIVVIAKSGYSISLKEQGQNFPAGSHGYSSYDGKDMHGIFYAQGPNIRSPLKIKSFENIHIYPWIAKILGLKITEKIDGKEEVLSPTALNPGM